MQSVLQHWGAGIFSLLIAVFTAAESIQLSPFNWVVIWQLIPIVATGLITWIIPLGSGKWPGAWKTGLEILSIAATIILPYWISGHWTFANIILIGLAILKGAATELGVQIRTTSPAVTTASGATATVLAQPVPAPIAQP